MSKARNLSDLLADGVIGSSEIADGAITEAKIDSGAVTANKLQTGAAVPAQSGQSGKYLTTDGSTTSWATVDTSQGDTAYGWGDHSTQNYATTTGDTMTGNLNFGDNVKAQFGASNDLQIYHDGSNSYISDQGTGNLVLRGQNNVIIQDAAGTDTLAAFQDNGAVSLYYDGSAKLATTSTGVSVTGTVAATSFSGDGSALTGIQAGDGTLLGTIKGYANGGYFIGMQATGLPVGKTLVYAFKSITYNNSPVNVSIRSGGGSPGITGGTWRKVERITQNSHSPVSVNFSGTSHSAMSTSSSTVGQNQSLSPTDTLFVTLTSSTANIPMYYGNSFEFVVDVHLLD